MNTLKAEFNEESIGKAQQHIFNQLKTLLDLKLPKILENMYDSKSIAVTRESNDKVIGKLSEEVKNSKFTTEDKKRSSLVSNHPVAIFDKQGKISPSALIPFCSFGSKMLGTKVPTMTFPVCDIFEPTVYGGGQCYKVDVGQSKPILKGKKNGLMLLIDVNEERSYNIERPNSAEESEMFNVYLGKDQMTNKNLARIHIGTLAPHFEEGPGDYVLTSLKQMTGTENFLAWPQEKRECLLENFESCQKKIFLEKISESGCSPFSLILAAGPSHKVKL